MIRPLFCKHYEGRRGENENNRQGKAKSIQGAVSYSVMTTEQEQQAKK